MKKTILVTGSDGFIGSHLVQSLTKNIKSSVFVFTIVLIWGWLNDLKEVNKKI